MEISELQLTKNALINDLNDLQSKKDSSFEEAFKKGEYECLKQLVQGKFSSFVSLLNTISRVMKVDGSHIPLTRKCNRRSQYVRNRADYLAAMAVNDKDKLLVAMCAYDLALCYARTPESMGEAYGKVTAVYIQLKLIPQALKSFANFTKFADNAKLEPGRLQNLSRLCQQLTQIHNSKKDFEPAKLTYPSHPNISGLVKLVKFCEKSVVTEEPLEYGDIIAVTKSFCFVNESPLRRQFCNQCGDRTSDKIPCDHCNFAVFCGESCKALAIKEFHGIECGLCFDFAIDKDPVMYLALKFACNALRFELDSKFYETTNPFTVFDWMEGDEENHVTILKTILSMKHTDPSFKQTFALVLYFVSVMEKAQKHEGFQKFIKSLDNWEKSLFDMFCKSYLAIKRNYFRADFTVHIDWLYGNLKHSCKPNVTVVHDSKLGTNTYLVLDRIAAGEDLTIAYG